MAGDGVDFRAHDGVLFRKMILERRRGGFGYGGMSAVSTHSPQHFALKIIRRKVMVLIRLILYGRKLNVFHCIHDAIQDFE
jgi:hypothetical protein